MNVVYSCIIKRTMTSTRLKNEIAWIGLSPRLYNLWLYYNISIRVLITYYMTSISVVPFKFSMSISHEMKILILTIILIYSIFRRLNHRLVVWIVTTWDRWLTRLIWEMSVVLIQESRFPRKMYDILIYSYHFSYSREYVMLSHSADKFLDRRTTFKYL